MKQGILIIQFVLCCMISSKAQPVIEWAKCFGGPKGEWTTSVQQTSDGGYIVLGQSNSDGGQVTGHHGLGGNDYWLVKMDSAGVLQWQVCLGGNDQEYAQSVRQTTDGGYIVAGTSRSTNGNVTGNHGDFDAWVAKVNSAGAIEWQKSYGGSRSDLANCIRQTGDGGYIFSGSTESPDGDVTNLHDTVGQPPDIWVIKTNSTGAIQWQKTLGGMGADYSYAMELTSDGGYIIGGTSYSLGGDVTGHHGSSNFGDFWIVKLNSAGAIQWQQSLGGLNTEDLWSIRQTADKGYACAGYSRSSDSLVTDHHGSTSYGDFYIVKTDSMGVMQWQKSYGGSEDDRAQGMQVTSDGGYVLLGPASSIDGDVTGLHSGSTDMWIVKLNESGQMEWQRALGGSSLERGYEVEQTADGGYILTGESFSTNGDVSGNHSTAGSSDFWVVKLKGAVVLPPAAAFRASDSSFCSSACINFTDLSSRTPTSWLWSFPGGLPQTSTNKHPQNICYLNDGVYPVTLIASNSGGADTLSLTDYIYVKAAPPAPVITQSGAILSCSSDTSYISYQWYADSTLLAGATDTFLVITHNGNYNVRVMNKTGCSIAVGINVILGLQADLPGAAITFSPNPAGDMLYIDGSALTEACQLTVSNVLGEQVISRTLSHRTGDRALLHVAALPPGIYFVSLISEAKKHVGMFVKQ